MSTRRTCPQCGNLASLFLDCDTLGCIQCNIWTEQPHACSLKYGACDEGFSDAPAYPSDYKGVIKYPPEYK